MRRRRSRRRFVGLMVGTALFGGLIILDRTIAPEPPDLLGVSGAPAALATASQIPQAMMAGANERTTPMQGALAAPVRSDILPPPDAVAAANEPAGIERAAERPQTVEARPGDTPLSLLTRIGIAREDAQAAVRQLSTVWDPRGLRAGQKAAVFRQSDHLLSVRLVLAPGRDVVVARDDSGRFVAEDQDRPTSQVTALGTGTIHTSLSEAASRAGVPAGVLGEMIRAFSYDVDFQREVHPGDAVTVLYQRLDDEFGRPTGSGHMLYAEMILSGTRLRLYCYAPPGAEVGY